VSIRRVMTSGDGRNPAVTAIHQLFFLSELLSPSKPLWIVSAWLSDIPVTDNRGGELLGAAPGLPARELSVLELIAELVGRGGQVRVVVRDEPHNAPVLAGLDELARRSTAGKLHVGVRPDLHDKILASERLVIDGSMNLTHSGTSKNEEGLRVVSDPEDVAIQRHELARRFGGTE
jgi:hypothetical protein